MCECYFFEHYSHLNAAITIKKVKCFMCNAAEYGKDRIYRNTNSRSILLLKIIDDNRYIEDEFIHRINLYINPLKCTINEYILYKKYLHEHRNVNFNSLSFSFIAFIKLIRFLKKAQSKFFTNRIKFGYLKVQQKGLGAITCKVRYMENSSPFLNTIFSKISNFSPNDFTSEGHFIFRSTKYELLQSTVILYSQYSLLINIADRKQIIYKFLNDNSTNYDLFCENYHSIIKIVDLFKMHEMQINNYLSEYLDDYTSNTIFLNKANTTDKLLLFCKKCPTIAEFIWNGTFSSEAERELIYYRLSLPVKLKKAFVKSKTVSELFKKLNMRRQLKIPVDDRWVNELQSMGEKGILLYEQLCDLLDYIEISKYPHYISGFIDGDRISSAESIYWQKYSEAQSFYAKGKK